MPLLWHHYKNIRGDVEFGSSNIMMCRSCESVAVWVQQNWEIWWELLNELNLRNLLLFLHIDCVCCFRRNSCGDVQLQETGSSGHKPKQLDRINPHTTGIHPGPIPTERISQRTLWPNSCTTANGADTEHHRLLIQQLVRGHPTVRLIQCVSLWRQPSALWWTP